MFKNLLLQNQKAYDFETWHEALRNEGLQNLYKSWHWDDLDPFHGKVNLDRPCIWMEKIVKMSFEGQNLQLIGKWTEFLWFEKDINSRSYSDPALGLYTCIVPF